MRPSRRHLPAIFADALESWRLVPDGAPLETHSARLLPVRRQGTPAVLKIATSQEERRGAALMAWWGGTGAAKVLAHAGDALLLERADTQTSLADLVASGHDDDASRIICTVVSTLHRPKAAPPETLVPLRQWFDGLLQAPAPPSEILALCRATARDLLTSETTAIPLHGDIHHGNILHFGDRGWLAIDPKGLIGDPGFDYANIFCNPDGATATAPGRLARQVDVVAEAAALDRERLLQWILAWAGLSATWLLEDGASATTPLRVAELAARQLAP